MKYFFSKKYMINLGASFVFVLTTLYGFYSLFFSKWPSEYSLESCIHNACACIYYSLYVIINTTVGHKINHEVNILWFFSFFWMKFKKRDIFQSHRTAFLVNKALGRSKDKSKTDQLLRFLQQLGHTNPNISCGLFDININFLITVNYFQIMAI